MIMNKVLANYHHQKHILMVKLSGDYNLSSQISVKLLSSHITTNHIITLNRWIYIIINVQYIDKYLWKRIIQPFINTVMHQKNLFSISVCVKNNDKVETNLFGVMKLH